MTKVRLVVADKSELFRQGLVKLLEHESSIEVVCTCRTGLEAVESANEHQPDVILIDIELSECSGIEAMMRIHERLPKTGIIVLTRSEANTDFLSAVNAGARAYISKDISLQNLIKAIALVAEAEFRFLKEHKVSAEVRDVTLLSKREQAVLSLVAQGFTNREIAISLLISENTVKVHLRNIMEKLHAHTRQQAVVLARGKTTI